MGHRVVAPPTSTRARRPIGPQAADSGPSRRPSGRLIPRTAQGGVYAGAGRADEPTPGLSRAHFFSALAAFRSAGRQLASIGAHFT